MARTQEVVIMDIGSSSIRMLVVTKPGSGVSTVRNFVKISYDGYMNGSWVDSRSAQDAIITAISRTKDFLGKIKRLYVGVPADFCTLRTNSTGVTFPKRRKVDKSDLDALFDKADPFRAEADKVLINQSSVYYMVDGARKVVDPEGMSMNELTGFLSYIAVDEEIYRFLDDTIKRAGVAEAKYTCGMYAMMMGMFETGVRDSGLVVTVDAGYLSSTVAVMRGDGLMHMATFPCGKGVFAAWMSQGLGIPFDCALDLFNKTDLSYNPKEGENYTVNGTDDNGQTFEVDFAISTVQDYVSECIAVFAQYVNDALRSFEEPLSGSTGVYLTGGGLAIRGADDTFSKKMGGRYVKIATPSSCHEYKQPAYSDSIGLAEYAFLQEELKRNRFGW